MRWDHRQNFDLSTSLNLNLNYASSTRVIRQNAIDPLQNTQQITSSLNFSKRYGWGTLTLGGNRFCLRQAMKLRTELPTSCGSPRCASTATLVSLMWMMRTCAA